MKHLKKTILPVIIALLCVLFLVSEILDFRILGLYSRALIFPFLLIYYIVADKKKKLFFILFLVFFTAAEVILLLILDFNLYRKFGEITSNIGTSCYVLGYVSLLVLILSNIKLKSLFKRFPLHSGILILFGLYLLYALNNMLTHHGLASMSIQEYVLASVYNLMIILVLIASLLAYLYRDTRKALILFIACLCIVFSDLVQTAYFFMAREELLNLVYTILLSIGFFMLFVFMAYTPGSKPQSEVIDEEKDHLSII